jgi:hypothetical protein
VKAVWSFWSKPFLTHHRSVWASEKHHLLAWVLSTQTVMRHYRPAVLYTDDAGARMLVDGIGLEFDQVSTSLNALHTHDPEWWALGKVYTYCAQTEPFVHLDSDVFLWKPLPAALESAPLLAQNPEYFTAGESYYQPEALESALQNSEGGWLPPEWQWYRARGATQRAECCGVFGGTRVDFIRHYATQAIRLIEHRGNHIAWERLAGKIGHNILFEQYLLAACIEYHRGRTDSPFREIDIRYVFASLDEAFDPETATQAGYTHLIADAKCNWQLANRLEARVAQDYPDHYQRCLNAGALDHKSWNKSAPPALSLVARSRRHTRRTSEAALDPDRQGTGATETVGPSPQDSQGAGPAGPNGPGLGGRPPQRRRLGSPCRDPLERRPLAEPLRSQAPGRLPR